jgi:hypothetical protein
MLTEKLPLYIHEERINYIVCEASIPDLSLQIAAGNLKRSLESGSLVRWKMNHEISFLTAKVSYTKSLVWDFKFC